MIQLACSCCTWVMNCPVLNEVSWASCVQGQGCSGIILTALEGLKWMLKGL